MERLRSEVADLRMDREFLRKTVAKLMRRVG